MSCTASKVDIATRFLGKLTVVSSHQVQYNIVITLKEVSL